MNKIEANQKIKELTEAARKSLYEAASIADTFGVSFSWDFEYGMSGQYFPQNQITREEAFRLIESGAPLNERQRTQIANILRHNPGDDAPSEWEESNDYEGWTSSSNMC